MHKRRWSITHGIPSGFSQRLIHPCFRWRSEPKGYEFGWLVALPREDGKVIVHLGAIWSLPNTTPLCELMEKADKLEYAGHQAMLDDGWRVD